MFHEEYPTPTEADFENLPPLVAEGENRQEKLTQVIDRWEALTPEALREYEKNKKSQQALEEHPASLFKIDLRDDNPAAEPIDLNEELLKPLAERLVAKAKDVASSTESSSANNKSLATVPLLCCKIHRGGISEIDLHADLISVSCFFENGLRIWGSTFHGELDLRKSIFKKRLDISGSVLKSAVELRSVNCAEWMFIIACLFEQRVDLNRLVCSGGFSCISSIFKSHVDYSRSKLPSAHIERCLMTGHTYFNNTIFQKELPIFDLTDLRCAKIQIDKLPLAVAPLSIETYRRFVDYIH